VARPNTLTLKIEPGEAIVQMVSNVEFISIADKVLEELASSDGAGDLFLTAGANGNYTSIGGHTNTRTEAVGSSDLTITSSTTTLYQDLVSGNIDAVVDKPVTFDYTTSSFRSVTNAELDSFADDIIDYMVNNEAAGSYRIANTSPAGTYGGTWTTVATILNEIDNSTSTSSFLYKKITDSSTLLCRPLRYVGYQGESSLQLMTDDQIKQLARAVRSRIVSNNIGKYLFQNSTPVSGTWVNVGTITDTRRDIQTVTNYIGPAQYTGGSSYTGPAQYTGPQTFAGTDSFSIAQDFSGTAQYASGGSFFGPVQYTGTTGYGGTSQFAGETDFVGPVQYFGTAQYTGIPLYVGPSANYSGAPAQFLGVYPWAGPDVSFTGGAYYVGPPAQYTGEDPFFQPGQEFSGGPYYYGPGPSFTGTGQYTGWIGFTGQYVGIQFPFFPYVGPGFGPQGEPNEFYGPGPEATYVGPEYTRLWQFTGPRDYIGDAGYIGPTIIYYGPGQQFAGTSEQQFFGIAGYIGPGQQFVGPALFAGVAQYEGPYPWAGPPTQFAGEIGFGSATLYYGPVQYTGPATFFGPAQFAGTAEYSSGGDFTGPALYSGVRTYVGPVNYLGVSNFVGTADFGGTSQFTGTATYTAGTFSQVVSSISTISQTTLWRRVA